jgi:diguanylate cyclase (GGDEF)-like protein
LEREVVTDPVTGLANYRRFENVFSAEVERSRRNGRPFALLLLDLDGLKKINDTHGHSIGSQALRRVAIVLQFHSRAVDTAARYGGDEFAVLLPETGAERAWRVAERIAERVADDGEEPRLSISFGISVYPQDGETIGEIFRTADAALYAMKRAGGSRVSS